MTDAGHEDDDAARWSAPATTDGDEGARAPGPVDRTAFDDGDRRSLDLTADEMRRRRRIWILGALGLAVGAVVVVVRLPDVLRHLDTRGRWSTRLHRTSAPAAFSAAQIDAFLVAWNTRGAGAVAALSDASSRAVVVATLATWERRHGKAGRLPGLGAATLRTEAAGGIEAYGAHALVFFSVEGLRSQLTTRWRYDGDVGAWRLVSLSEPP